MLERKVNKLRWIDIFISLNLAIYLVLYHFLRNETDAGKKSELTQIDRYLYLSLYLAIFNFFRFEIEVIVLERKVNKLR